MLFFFISLECVPEVEHFIASPSAGNSHLQSVQKLTPFVPMSLFYGQLILVLTFDIFTIFFLNICFVSYLIFVSIKKNWLQLESFLLNVKYIEFSFRCQFCQFLCELQKMLWTSINQSQNQESVGFFSRGSDPDNLNPDPQLCLIGRKLCFTQESKELQSN